MESQSLNVRERLKQEIEQMFSTRFVLVMTPQEAELLQEKMEFYYDVVQQIYLLKEKTDNKYSLPKQQKELSKTGQNLNNSSQESEQNAKQSQQIKLIASQLDDLVIDTNSQLQEQLVNKILNMYRNSPKHQIQQYIVQYLLAISTKLETYQNFISFIEEMIHKNEIQLHHYKMLFLIFKRCNMDSKIIDKFEQLTIHRNSTIDRIACQAVCKVYGKSKDKEFIKIFKRILQINRNSVAAIQYISNQYFIQQKYKKCQQYLKRGFQIQRTSLLLYMQLHLHYQCMTERQQFLIIAKQYLSMVDDQYIRILYGQACFQLNRIKEGYQMLQRISIDSLDGENIEIISKLIKIQMLQKKQFNERVLLRNIYMNPKQSSYFRLARYFLKTKQYKRGKCFIESIIVAHPFFAQLYVCLFQIYLKIDGKTFLPFVLQLIVQKVIKHCPTPSRIQQLQMILRLIQEANKESQKQIQLCGYQLEKDPKNYLRCINFALSFGQHTLLKDLIQKQKRFMHSANNIGLILFYETLGHTKQAEKFIIPLIEESLKPTVVSMSSVREQIICIFLKIKQTIYSINNWSKYHILLFTAGIMEQFCNYREQSSKTFRKILQIKENDRHNQQIIVMNFKQWWNKYLTIYSPTTFLAFTKFMVEQLLTISVNKGIDTIIYICQQFKGSKFDEWSLQLSQLLQGRMQSDIAHLYKIANFIEQASGRQMIFSIPFQIQAFHSLEYQVFLTTHCSYLKNNSVNSMEKQLQKDLVELINANLSYQLVSKFIDDTISVNINKFSIQFSQQCYKRLTQIFENKLASIKILLLEDLLFAKVSPKMPANKMIIQSFIERFKQFCEKQLLYLEFIVSAFNRINRYIFKQSSHFRRFSQIMIDFVQHKNCATFINQISDLLQINKQKMSEKMSIMSLGKKHSNMSSKQSQQSENSLMSLCNQQASDTTCLQKDNKKGIKPNKRKYSDSYIEIRVMRLSELMDEYTQKKQPITLLDITKMTSLEDSSSMKKHLTTFCHEDSNYSIVKLNLRHKPEVVQYHLFMSMKKFIDYLSDNILQPPNINKMKKHPKKQQEASKKFKFIQQHKRTVSLKSTKGTQFQYLLERVSKKYSRKYDDIKSEASIEDITSKGFKECVMWISNFCCSIIQLIKYGVYLRNLSFQSTFRGQNSYKLFNLQFIIKFSKFRDQNDHGLLEAGLDMVDWVSTRDEPYFEYCLSHLFLKQFVAIPYLHRMKEQKKKCGDQFLKILKKDVVNYYKSTIKTLSFQLINNIISTKPNKQNLLILLNIVKQINLMHKDPTLSWMDLLAPNLKNIFQIKIEEEQNLQQSQILQILITKLNNNQPQLNQQQISKTKDCAQSNLEQYSQSIDFSQKSNQQQEDIEQQNGSIFFIAINYTIGDLFKQLRKGSKLDHRFLLTFLQSNYLMSNYIQSVQSSVFLTYNGVFRNQIDSQITEYSTVTVKGDKDFSIKWKKKPEDIDFDHLLCHLGFKYRYCWLISMAKIILQHQKLGIMNSDLKISNTIKFNEIFLGLDFDFALKIKRTNQKDGQLFETTKNLIEYWLQKDNGPQIAIFSHYFLYHVDANLIKKHPQYTKAQKIERILVLLNQNLSSFHLHQFQKIIVEICSFMSKNHYNYQQIEQIKNLSKKLSSHQNYQRFIDEVNQAFFSTILPLYISQNQDCFGLQQRQTLCVENKVFDFISFQNKNSQNVTSLSILFFFFRNMYNFMNKSHQLKSIFLPKFYVKESSKKSLSFSATANRNYTQIKTISDIIRGKKRLVYSWIISLANIITQLQKQHTFLSKISFSALARVGEHFQLHELSNILNFGHQNLNQHQRNQNINLFLQMLTSMQKGERIRTINKIFGDKAIQVLTATNIILIQQSHLQRTMRENHKHQFIARIQQLLSQASIHRIITAIDYKQLLGLLKQFRNDQLSYLQLAQKMEVNYYKCFRKLNQQDSYA